MLLETGTEVGGPQCSVPSSHCVPGPAQVLRQIRFHPEGCLKRHGVQVSVQLGKEPDAVTFHHVGRSNSRFMVRKTFARFETRHAHVNARLLRVTSRIGSDHPPVFAHDRVKQDHVDVMVVFGFAAKLMILQRPYMENSAQLHVHYKRRFCRKSSLCIWLATRRG